MTFSADGGESVPIELWDDEVDSIRSFDAESQRSIENLMRSTFIRRRTGATKEERDAGIARILQKQSRF